MKFQICFLFTAIVLSGLVGDAMAKPFYRIGTNIVDVLRHYNDYNEKNAINFGIFLDDLQDDVYKFITFGKNAFAQTKYPNQNALDALYKLTLGYIKLVNSIEYSFVDALKKLHLISDIGTVISDDLKDAFILINCGLNTLHDLGVPREKIVPKAVVSFNNVHGPFKQLLRQLQFYY